ncbi:DUF2520 domain-containing protein [Flavobacteriaceae bacterium]|jgi:predicted short-subunit dehydrogenase-like oxidoreductase (DUF2520 family)|nr:DUF2520 domain-containing protein [Flavobacteriaceae bacterium]|tara:strand:- start:1090 stop:1854 length:765 start_codon:yes stop_codon:yes gene_type:complete
MIKVVIIGTGNVAYHISKAVLKNKKLEIAMICGRKKKLPTNFSQDIAYSNNFKKIKKADLYIICINDDNIFKISEKLNIDKKSIVVHTSGSTELNVLSKHNNYGVIYPLQTFSKDKEIEFSNVPIIIEANSKLILSRIKEISSFLSNKVLKCNSNQRTFIHISAIFTNNFSNFMNVIAQDILKSQDIDSEILKPLINETIDKLNFLTSKEAQTGPAARNDKITIEKHLNLLKKTKYFETYNALTKEIINLKNEL